MQENTTIFDEKTLKTANIGLTIKAVRDSLDSNGYDAESQIVGYLLSGDPGYITSKNGARESIVELDRAEILELLVDSYLEKE